MYFKYIPKTVSIISYDSSYLDQFGISEGDWQTRWDYRQGQLFSTIVDSHKLCELCNFHLIMRIA